MADTWLDPQKKKDLLSYIEQGALEGDLYAAGYTQDDLFEVGYFAQPSVEPFVPREEDTIQAYEPTQRENYRVGIQEKLKGFGVDDSLSSDIAESITGNTSPTDGSLGMGVMDFTPFGAGFAVQEGSRTAKKGWESGDALRLDPVGAVFELDDLISSYGKPFSGNSLGIEIDISGIREKYDLSKPRFAQGGMVESNMIDPVSKNPVPPGATPKEVRDDVDIKASEGEYVIPADVVRFLGLDKIEKMIGAAKKGIMQMQEAGRIGGSKPGEDDLPFHPSELQAADDAPQAPARMAVGGMVTQAPQQFNPYMLRRPEPGQPYQPQTQGQPRDDRSEEERRHMTPTGMAGNPDQWELDDFNKYVDNRGSGVNRLIEQGIKSLVPMGGMALEARYKYLDKAVPEQITKTLETGVDSRGNRITTDQRTRLTEALEKLKTEERPASGFGKGSGGLMGGLFDMAMDRFAPKEQPKKEEPVRETREPAREAREAAQKDDKDEASRTESSSSSSAADRHDTGNYGKDSNYRKGGLVSRRK